MSAPLLVVGSGPLTTLLTEQLRRDGRRFAAFADADAIGTRPRRAEAVLLVAPPDPAAALAQIVTGCQDRPQRLAPLRLLLITDGPSPPLIIPVDAPLHLEPVDLQRRAARLLLRRLPLHFGADPLFGQRIHLVLAGSAPPIPALLPQALRVAQYGEQPALVSVLDPDPAAREAAFTARYPMAGACAEVRFLAPEDPALTRGDPVTMVIIASDPPAPGLALAQALAARIAASQHATPPILLEIGAAEPRGEPGDWDGQTFPLGYRREVLHPARLLDGNDDSLAQIIHDHYRDSIEAQGRDPLTEAASQPWARLAESYRDANRHQADHLWAKLALTDCRALSEDLVEAFAFTGPEVERLAVIEHARWAADRWLDGWTYAPVRDNTRKHHPQLIPYRDLSGPMQDLDRFAVRLAPTLLARSGLGVLRMLIVGIESTAGAPVRVDGLAGARLRGQITDVLDRLSARFPDRALVLASTLADPAARCLVRRALERHGAALFWLAEHPITATLAALTDAAGEDLLRLLARAERRIPLAGTKDLARWLAQRAEVLVRFGEPGQGDGHKRVCIDASRALHWSFEY